MFVIIIFPLLDNDSSIISRLGASLVNSSTYFKVSLAIFSESVTKKHEALGSCPPELKYQLQGILV